MKFSFAAKAAFLLSSAVLATAATTANVASPVLSVLLAFIIWQQEDHGTIDAAITA